MITLAHEHAYSRTYLLSDFSNQTIIHRSNEMSLEPGQSFAFVSGLGGREVRGQARGGNYFASVYTADQGASAGALFCTFDVDTADFYFKAIDGAVPDQFTLTRGSNTAQVSSPPPELDSTVPSSDNNAGYVFSRSDKNEYRWIDETADGQVGSIWIDQACAEDLGGVTATGDWGELMRRAPGFDRIANPCANTGVEKSSNNPSVGTAISTEGFAFSRTDKNEYRWIDTNTSGNLGSVD